MATTTPRSVRDDFIQQIIGLTPSHTEYQHERWHRLRDVAEVKGSGMRGFFIENVAPEFVAGADGGIYDIGQRTKQYRMLVWTSYRGLSSDDSLSIISEDSDQLLHTFMDRVGTLAGLWAIPEPDQEWVPGGESEDGAVWGAHAFAVHYLADTTT